MSQAQALRKLRKSEKVKLGNLVKTPKNVEVTYRRQLLKIVKSMIDAVKTQIIPVLIGYESEYVADAYAVALEEAFERLRTIYAGIEESATIVATQFIDNANEVQKQRFYASLKNAIGVNLQSIVQNEGLSDILIASTRENVGLIRSIPQKHFSSLEVIVYDNTVRGTTAGSIIKQIQDLTGVATRRANIIARDQTSKINSVLNQQRQENLAVTQYIWRTADDARVRDTHADNNGKVFDWNSPPPLTGHPGHDPLCRCVAQPIIPKTLQL